MDLALQIASGIGLASCAGLRAFLPLFAVGLAGRAEVIQLGRGFGWLASTPALVVLGTAVMAELLADKIPVVDHLLDALGLFVKPLAGTLAMASTLSDTSPLAAVVLAFILGLPVASAVHLAKAKVRLVSSLATGGIANPLQSAAEDAVSIAGCTLCVALPLVGLATLLVLGLILLGRRRMAGRLAP